MWEPLLEPLEVEKTDLFKPWILEIKVYFPVLNSKVQFQYLRKHKCSAPFIAEITLNNFVPSCCLLRLFFPVSV